MTEKTWPVNVGEAERLRIIAIQETIKAKFGYGVTQRAVVTRAINKMYDEIFPATPSE